MIQHGKVALLLVGLFLGGRSIEGQSIYKKTTVCKVLAAGKADRLLHVRIDADVLSDGKHGAILTDSGCSDRGLLLDVFPAGADPSVADFEKTLWSDGSPGTTGRKVSGTFFGKLKWDRSAKKLNIEVLRVENLRNIRTSPKNSDLP